MAGPRRARLAIRVLAAIAFAAVATWAPPGPPAASAIGCITNCTALTVALTGTGSGTWRTTNSSYVPNNVINCTLTSGVMSGTCFFKYQNTYPPQNLTIYYLVTPAERNDGCSGSTCSPFPQKKSMTFYANTTVTSWTFQPNPRDWTDVIIEIGGTGSGKVTADTGLSCTTAQARCDSYVPGTPSYVSFTESPDPGSYFVSWDRCPSTVTTCPVMTANEVGAVYATFDSVGGPTPSPTARPTPTPTAAPTPTASPTATATTKASSGPSASPGASLPGSSSMPGPSRGPESSGAGQSPAASGGNATSGSAESTAPGASDAGSAVAPGNSGGVAALSSGQPAAGGTPIPGDAAPAASPGGSDQTGPIIIAVGLVIGGLVIAGALFATRTRRPRAG